MKIMLTCILAFLVLLSACSSRNEPTNAYDEYRQSRDEQLETSAIYQEKEDLYTSNLRELTFTGKAEDLSNVVFVVNSELVTVGLPRIYQFIQQESHLKLDVVLYEYTHEDDWQTDYIEESLVVEDILFDDGTYTVEAGEYTFKLHTFQESIRRLRDDSGEMLRPSHYIPEELQEQWLREAEDEVRN